MRYPLKHGITILDGEVRVRCVNALGVDLRAFKGMGLFTVWYAFCLPVALTSPCLNGDC